MRPDDHISPPAALSFPSAGDANSNKQLWRFSVAEVAVMVIVLGLLGMLVVPRLTRAGGAGRELSLRDNLSVLRTKIMIYRAQHRGVAPGYPGGDAAMLPTHEAFVAQMTRFTDETGQTSDTPSDDFRFGPYLLAVPRNPLNESADIRFMHDVVLVPSAGGEQGWVYHPVTGSIVANVPGVDISGVRYIDY